ncbi:MAG: DUF4352 domain-containing protein [Chloroflexi bacterium]|nr:DUF4352 domain-containing protein [Chloroflexota bacterium]
MQGVGSHVPGSGPVLVAWRLLLALVVVGTVVALVRPTHASAQTDGRLTEQEYDTWRADHAAALDAAAAAMLASAPGDDQAATLATLIALADTAARIRPPEAALGAHAQYLIAVERLRLAAMALAEATSPGPAAEGLARAQAELRELLATGRLPPAEAVVPPAPAPLAPPAAIAQASTEVGALWLLGVQRPFTPRGAEPPAGQEFIALRLRLENRGRRALAYYPLADFTLITRDGVTLHPTALGMAERVEAGELSPGDALITTITFLIGPDTQPALLRFAPASGAVIELPLPTAES